MQESSERSGTEGSGSANDAQQNSIPSVPGPTTRSQSSLKRLAAKSARNVFSGESFFNRPGKVRIQEKDTVREEDNESDFEGKSKLP